MVTILRKIQSQIKLELTGSMQEYFFTIINNSPINDNSVFFLWLKLEKYSNPHCFVQKYSRIPD